MESPAKYSLGLIATLMMGLTLGFFGGREYVKYELRTALQTVTAGLQRGLDDTPVAQSPPAKTVVSAPVTAPPPAKEKEPSPVAFTLVHKGFHPKNIHAGDFQEEITFDLSIKNLTNRDIRAFDGILTFTDLLDNEILTSKLAINDPVRASMTMSWSGMIDYNEFIDRHRRLRGAEEDNLKITFKPNKVLFTDGTTKQFGG
jgi:hypothetical protein